MMSQDQNEGADNRNWTNFFSDLSLHLTSLDVCTDVNFFWELSDLDLESILDRLRCLGVLLVGDKRDCETLGTKSTGSRNSMQVGVGVFGHIVVEHDVHSLDIHTTTEKVGGDEDTSLEIFEELVSLKTFFLIHGSVNIDGGEVLFLEERGERDAPLHGLDEDNDLVEFERVEQIEKLSVLLVLLDLDIVLLETVEGQLGFVVDEDFHGLQRERRLESDYRASHLMMIHHRTEPILVIRTILIRRRSIRARHFTDYEGASRLVPRKAGRLPKGNRCLRW